MLNFSPTTYSIVSHGQGRLVNQLLYDINNLQEQPLEIILTLNIPEDEEYLRNYSNLKIKIIRNSEPKGFGSNHNFAFQLSNTDYFVIINPDIRIPVSFQIKPMLDYLSNEQVAAIAPAVYSASGGLEDSARVFPTILKIAFRVMGFNSAADYEFCSSPIDVDWVAGMFIIFNKIQFAEVSGFDESYFMYCEDIDICQRLRKLNYKIVLDYRYSVIHDAQRTSRRNIKYLFWHMKSLFRYFFAHKSFFN